MLSRVVVKLSGEALAGDARFGIDPTTLSATASEVAAAANHAQLSLVIGGGNLFRGAGDAGLGAVGVGRVTGDHMGMLATLINALAFRDALVALGTPAVVLGSHAIPTVAEGYSVHETLGHLQAGTVVLHAGGTGNPLFTTDTAACLRGIETGADLIVKATKVDGVYSADPLMDSAAERFDELTYMEVLDRRLEVMDLTAITLCREHGMPVVVCDATRPGTLTRIVCGAKVGTRIS
ncbi:MAG: UMP kinase [Gammaproteobacteria bacterium]|nr:UMP kinase [Gammaproteobacteria bacterium]MXY58479.1 UMP kinase [Gammaproteobacteria bacterium]MYF29995.1 UMP kinase [Gammaproteobacteria bacterium]MYK48159.1 UMP kinase [Gammaproteobacteria bacterium]